MKLKPCVIIAVIVLCSFAGNVHGHIKCVQCGITSFDAVEIVAKIITKGGSKNAEDVQKQLAEHFCPGNLPAPTDCDINDKFCLKLVEGNNAARRCNSENWDGCNQNACAYSCDTDGCNLGEHHNVNNVLLGLVAILGLLFTRFLSTLKSSTDICL